MDDYGPSTYGDRIAEVYDEWFPESSRAGEVDAAVPFLRDLAGAGPALELGIGTGRVALPLQREAVEIHGIDASEAMLARLRAKEGGARISTSVADFRDFRIEARFTLAYVVFNTFFALPTQDDQVMCFQAVARHLTPDGVFVIEAFVPDVARFDRGQRVSAIAAGTDEVQLEVSTHDAIAQRTESHHVVIGERGIRLYPVRIRYAPIAELDLMARIAGMRLRERWADWDRSELTSTSQKHISVWELDLPGGSSDR
jgi:SAM-dependent methyltransferase